MCNKIISLITICFIAKYNIAMCYMTKCYVVMIHKKVLRNSTCYLTKPYALKFHVTELLQADK